jgi:nicotinate dehydrogenase subunit B
MMSSTSFSRRDLLKTGGALLVTFTFGGPLATRGHAQQGAPADLGKPLDLKQVDSFLAVHSDGSVTVYTGKVDLGTGLRMAVRQMAAEELGVPIERVSLVEGDTGLTPDQGSTGGSTGLTRGGIEVRQACATARQALITMGASRLGRPVSDLVLEGGLVRPASSTNGVGIGELVGGKRLSIAVDTKAPLRDPKTYTIVGKPLLRPDVPAKCTGKHTYVQDYSVPNMLHGRVIRPPAIGAKLVSIDESSIKAIPDTRLVRIENFLGVVAKNEWAAVRASRELKVTWSDWQGLPGSEDLDKWVRNAPIEKSDLTVSKGGDSAAALAAAPKKLSASYMWPNQSHASLGPSCAIADVSNGGATVWSSSQGPHALRQNLAKLFNIPADKLRVVYLDGAGCYGGNGNEDVAADAVLMSKAVGQPVRVQWMRHDEHGWDPKGPQQLLDLRAGIDPQGNIQAWETEMWLPFARPGGRPLIGIDLAGMPQDHGQGAGLLNQNGDPAYPAASVKVTTHWIKDTPIRPSNLRAPGKIANVFAVESFIDEIAHEAGIDPVEYRLRGLTDQRAIAVLKRATEMADWQPRKSPNVSSAQGSIVIGRGVAYTRYKQAENYVALTAEVAVDRTSGKITVRRVTCAHDCGLVVNPNALRNQIEGCIVQTISRTLYEEVKFDRSHVTTIDWVSYPILRFPEAPRVDVALIEHPELPLYGAGEAATAPVAAVIANAVFDATGIRLRTAPFTPGRVKAAMAPA